MKSNVQNLAVNVPLYSFTQKVKQAILLFPPEAESEGLPACENLLF